MAARQVYEALKDFYRYVLNIHKGGEDLSKLSLSELIDRTNKKLSGGKWLKGFYGSPSQTVELKILPLINEKGEINYEELTRQARPIIGGNSVFNRFSPQEQRGFAEGGANNVEASLLLAADEGAGGKNSTTPQAQESRIEKFAKEKGIWTDNTTQALTEKYGYLIGAGEEAIVWGDPENGKVIKTQDTFQYENLQQKLDGITLHNAHFLESAIKVLGFGRNAKGEFQLIVEQPFIKGEKLTIPEIKSHLEKIGFKENEDGQFSNGDTIIEDVHTGNAIKTPEGNIVVIDPIMRLNTKEQGYRGCRKLDNRITYKGNTGIVGKAFQEAVRDITGEINVRIGETKIEVGTKRNDTGDFHDWVIENHPEQDFNFDDAERQFGSQTSELYQEYKKNVGGTTTTQHSTEITPEIREAVGEGIPMFQAQRKAVEQFVKDFGNKNDFDSKGNVKPEVVEEIRRERMRIEQNAKNNGTYHKAPNGKQSNLSEGQWVMVRTKRFKDWFGD